MRVRVGDCVIVRLNNDPMKTYLGAVTCLRKTRFGSGKVTWEADTTDELQVGMRLQFHDDDERVIILPQDSIEIVMGPKESWEDVLAYEFVKTHKKALDRLVLSHYSTLEAPWKYQDINVQT